MRVDHAEIERLIDNKRRAKAAKAALGAPGELPEGGAVVGFPVAVFAPGSKQDRNDHFWSYAVSHEPGSVFPPGITAVRYHGKVNATAFRGRFYVAVGDIDTERVPAAGAEGSWGDDPPPWSRDLPANHAVPGSTSRQLVRTLTRAARRETEATEALMAIVRPFLAQIADTFGPQINHRRAHLDPDDVINEGWRRAYQLMDAFAGPGRPSAPWSTAVYRNCRRDMSRAVHALDGMSEAVATVRAACAAHPEVTDPLALSRLLAIQGEERRLARRRPDLAADERHDLAAAADPPCPVSLQQISWALAAPRTVSWEDPTGLEGGGGDGERRLMDRCSGVHDAGLAAIDAPVTAAARSLAEVAGADRRAMLDLLSDLGLGSGGDPAASRLRSLRRRVLAPFILPHERPHSDAVLQRAGQRARTKLVDRGELLCGDRLSAAWRAGVSEAEALRLDARLADA